MDLHQRIRANGGLVTNDVILSYFATSPFFDPSSINQELFLQNKDKNIMEELEKSQGLQFVIDMDFTQSAPRLFVINKIRRTTNNGRTKITVLDVFYCLDGSIMRAPQLIDLIRTRFGKAAMHLQKSFDSLFAQREHNIDVKNEQSEECVGMEL